MDSEVLFEFRAQLEYCRNGLLKTLGQVLEQARSFAADEPKDTADQSLVHASNEILFANSSHNRELLKLTEAALQRIQEGHFGNCALCEEEIGIRRLQAVPWAEYCIACQESVESKQKIA